MGLPLLPAITDANSKAVGIFPSDLAKVLCSANKSDWKLTRWIDLPPCKDFLMDLERLGENLIL
tara:strand:- start:217 stop:408 length:192 start_codon:yes stop_codon:yes gene_type:complete